MLLSFITFYSEIVGKYWHVRPNFFVLPQRSITSRIYHEEYFATGRTGAHCPMNGAGRRFVQLNNYCALQMRVTWLFLFSFLPSCLSTFRVFQGKKILCPQRRFIYFLRHCFSIHFSIQLLFVLLFCPTILSNLYTQRLEEMYNIKQTHINNLVKYTI